MRRFDFLQGVSPNTPVPLPPSDELRKLDITIKKDKPNESVEIELSVELCIKLSKYIC